MCTVSLIRSNDGVRLVCNRDELRTRPAAHPPLVVTRHGVRAVMPVDPESAGTWIAANEGGLVFVALNVNSGLDSNKGGMHSRGEIIPRLVHARTLSEATRTALDLNADRYRPHRLVIASVECAVEIAPKAGAVRVHSLALPVMFTSSGLGDSRVEGPRRALFRRVVFGDRNLVDRQDRFHAHRWRSRPHLSVLMFRADACTVSRTIIRIEKGAVAMIYEPQPSGPAEFIRLPRKLSHSGCVTRRGSQ